MDHLVPCPPTHCPHTYCLAPGTALYIPAQSHSFYIQHSLLRVISFFTLKQCQSINLLGSLPPLPSRLFLLEEGGEGCRQNQFESLPSCLSDGSAAEHSSVFNRKYTNFKVNKKTLSGVIKYTFRWVFKNLHSLVKTNTFSKCFLTDSRTQQFHALHLSSKAASARSARLFGSSDSQQNSKPNALVDLKVWNMTLSLTKLQYIWATHMAINPIVEQLPVMASSLRKLGWTIGVQNRE